MDINYYKKYEPIDGKWYITRELGSGAFGTVFEVERKDFANMKSAMKVITIPSSPNELKSFREDNYTLDERSVTSYFYGFVEEIMNEFNLMYQLKGHSNIVSYEDHDIIEHKDEIGWDVFIRMELLTPLSEHFARKTPGTDDIIRLGIDMCKALEVCKEANIIHRDIKPSNIFISDKGDYKLGDFGVARTLEKTSSGLSKKGTYIYMAPEVFKGERYGATVDIYSLGIVLYKLLNNNFEPFRTGISHSEAEIAMAKRMNGEKMPAPANAPGKLAEIILKACAYNPEDRYSDPAQMRAELEELLVTGDVPPVNAQPDATTGMFGSVNAPQTPVNAHPEATTGMFGAVNAPQPPVNAHPEATTGMFGAVNAPKPPVNAHPEATTGMFGAVNAPKPPVNAHPEATTGMFGAVNAPQPPVNAHPEATTGMFGAVNAPQPPVNARPEATTGMFGAVNAPQPLVNTHPQATTGMFGNGTVQNTSAPGQFSFDGGNKSKPGKNKRIILIAVLIVVVCALCGIIIPNMSSEPSSDIPAPVEYSASQIVISKYKVEPLDNAPKFRLGSVDSLLDGEYMGLRALLYFSDAQKAQSYDFEFDSIKIYHNGDFVGTNEGDPDLIGGQCENRGDYLYFQLWLQNMEYKKGHEYTLDMKFNIGEGADKLKYRVVVDFEVEEDCFPRVH